MSRHISRIYFPHFFGKHVLVSKQAKEDHSSHWLRLTPAWQRPWNVPSLFHQSITRAKERSEGKREKSNGEQQRSTKISARCEKGVAHALLPPTMGCGMDLCPSWWGFTLTVIYIHFFSLCRLFSLFSLFFNLLTHQGLLVSWVSLADDCILRCFAMEVVSAAKMTVLQTFYKQF